MAKLIGVLMIIGGIIPLMYLVITFFKRWKEKGNSFALKAVSLIIISFLLNTSGIIVCLGVIILGYCLIVYA
ncbi:hypothetical protein QRE66_27455 (plasmid) [Bacillus cereus]|nr:hypothetical protein QRE66_27455 [Bacillus cereus]